MKLEMKRILIYDDYNSRILQNQDCIGTITCNVGISAPRNGFKLIEIYYDSNNSEPDLLADSGIFKDE